MTARDEPRAVFDARHLATYTQGDADIEREVLVLFLEQAALLRSRLLGAPDLLQWHEAAHTLKGSARGVGAFRLGTAAARLEEIAELPGDRSERAELLAELAGEMDAAEVAMRRHLGR